MNYLSKRNNSLIADYNTNDNENYSTSFVIK